MLNKLTKMRHQTEEGFTLIELMIVVVIIGILAAIAIPIFMNQQKAAIAAGVKSDVKNTNTNIVTYLTRNPTATDFTGNWTGATSTTSQNIESQDKYKIIKSDENTYILVSNGKWNDYVVTGGNYKLNGIFAYDSKTGKFKGEGDFQ